MTPAAPIKLQINLGENRNYYWIEEQLHRYINVLKESEMEAVVIKYNGNLFSSVKGPKSGASCKTICDLRKTKLCLSTLCPSVSDELGYPVCWKEVKV